MIYQHTNSIDNFNYNAVIYADAELPMHFHRNYELIYVLRGVNHVKLNAFNIDLAQGQFLLISPNEPHSFELHGDSEAWVGVFSEDHIPAFANNHTGTAFSSFKCDTDIQKFFEKVFLSDANTDLYCRISCLYAICSQCIGNAEPLKKSVDPDIADLISTYIYKNYTENLTLKNVADSLGYEYHYFSKIFNKCFSMKFCEFLNICRFNKACELLSKRCDLTITQAALESGFGSIRSFNRVFKAIYGQTPHQYRKGLSELR